VQRPLWASTSTKNPNYPATYYVDALIGKHTVNTLPPSTLKAFTASTATPANTLTQDLDAAQQVMNKLAEVGVDMHAVTERLQHEGIEQLRWTALRQADCGKW
jgi:transaldolase